MSSTPNPQEEDLAANSIDENGHRPNPRTIYVNTRPHEVESNKVTFEELVTLAYPDPSPGTDLTFTITYSRGQGGHGAGSLTPGDSVAIKDGMVFDVIRTLRS